MIKQYKTALLFLGVIAVLLAAVFGMKYLKPSGDEPQNTIVPREQKEIFSVAREDIKTIAVQNPDDAYTFAYEGEEAKVLNRDFAQVDSFKLDSTALEFTSLKADETVFEETEEFAKFGLSNPQANVVLTDHTGKATKFLLGDKSPSGGGYYFAIEGAKAVYILPEYKGEIFLRKLDYYRKGTSIAVDTEKVTRIDISGKNKNMELSFLRNNVAEGAHNTFSVFSMTTPYQADAEGSEISSILEAVSGFTIEEYVEDDAKDLSKYGFDQYAIHITQGEQTDRLYFGNEYGDKIYIRINDSRNIYGIKKAPFAFLQAEPIKFISSMFYIKNLDTVESIDYREPLNQVSAVFRIKKLDEESHEVTINGKAMDEARFKALYIEIISLTMKGPINGVTPGEPILEYRFTFHDGTSDTVQYFQADERRIAISVNGKIQFYLNRSDLTAKMDTIASIIKEALQ